MSQEINGYLLRARPELLLISASGPIGTAEETVDVVSVAYLRPKSAGLKMTLPLPTDPRPGLMFNVYSPDDAEFPFELEDRVVAPGEHMELHFDGITWLVPSVPVAATPQNIVDVAGISFPQPSPNQFSGATFDPDIQQDPDTVYVDTTGVMWLYRNGAYVTQPPAAAAIYPETAALLQNIDTFEMRDKSDPAA
jgi:hypothetical protein